MSHTIAYHEAGHVVMAWLQGLSYDCVSLDDVPECPCHDVGLRDIDHSNDEVALFNRVAVILGGPLAETEFSGIESSTENNDYDYATDLLRCGGLLDVEWPAADVTQQLRGAWVQVERTAAALVARRRLAWRDVVDLLGVPGRSLSVPEQRARARGRILHRISERLDAELTRLECDDLPFDLCDEQIDLLKTRIRSTWSQWVETGQEAMRLRQRDMRQRGDRLVSVFCNPRAQCRAEYSIADIHNLCVDHFQEADEKPTPERYLLGEVDCDLMVSGYLCHSCPDGPPPHRLRIIVSKRDSEPELYDGLCASAGCLAEMSVPG